MLPYLFLFLLSLSLIFFDRQNKEPNYFWFYVFLVITSIISGLRDMIGGYDIFIYGQVYEAPVDGIMRYKPFEIGYKLYNILLKKINNDRQFLYFVSAFLISFLHFRVLKKYSPLLYFSLFILFCKFFLMSFVYLRQFIAMGIIWLSIPYILKKQYLKVFFIVLLTFFFHKSSVVFILLIFIWNVKFKNTTLFFIIVIVTFIGVSPLSQLLIDTVSESIDNSKIAAYAASNNAINIFYLLEIFLTSILLFKFKNDFHKKKFGRLIFNAVFLYIIFNTFSLFNANFIRFGWYFYIFVILFLSNIYFYIEDKKAKNFYRFIIVLYFSLIFFRLLFYWDGGDLIPYKSIYQDFHRPHLYDSFEYRPRKY